MISRAQGSLIKRKGFELVAPAKYDNKKVNIVRFRFSKDDTVLVEFGDLYVRFHTNGRQVREASKSIDSITAASPAVATSIAHGYSNGDEIYVSQLGEMVELNGRWLTVSNVTSDTFEITDRDGVGIDSSGWVEETTGGKAERVYEIASVYTEADLPNLDYAQKNDVMWVCDGAHPVQRLIRFGDTNWTISEMEFTSPATLTPNTETSHTISVGGTTGTGLAMTSTLHAPFLPEHVGSYWTLRHFRSAQEVTEAGVGHAIEVLGDVTLETSGKWTGTVNVHKETEAGSGDYTVAGVFTSDNAPDGSGKNFNVRFTEEDRTRNYYLSGDVALAKATLRSEAAIVEGAVKVTGYVSSSHLVVDVIQDLATTLSTSDWSEGAWSDVQGYPSVVCLYERSIWFARTPAYPQGIWKSETDLFDSFKLGDSDTSSLFLELDSKERNDILWMVDQDKLMIGTSGSEWTLSGTDLNSIISPTNIVARRQENKGSQDVRPETVDDVIMYVQRGSSQSLRAMSFSIERDKFHANNMQEFSEHLTTSGVVSIAYQGAPDPVLWCTTGDGRLLSFTYERDQRVFAWNPHNTSGLFEDVETIYGSQDDEVWVSVKRTVAGTTRRFIERMTGYYNPSSISGAGMVAFIIDLSGSMDDLIESAKAQSIALAQSMADRYSISEFALYTIADTGNTVVQKSGFTSVSEIVYLISQLGQKGTSTENGFEAIVRACDELDWDKHGYDSDRHIILVTDEDSDESETQANAISSALGIGAAVSFGDASQGGDGSGAQDYTPVADATGGVFFDDVDNMVESIEPQLKVSSGSSGEPVFLDSSLRPTLGVGADSTVLSGLWHLEGEKVNALADGYVYKDLLVTNGTVTLDAPVVNVFVGLQYDAVVQPMQINADSNVGSTVGYTKVVSATYALLTDTVGLKYQDGGSEPRNVTFRDGNQDQSLPPQLFTGEVELMFSTGYEKDPTIIFTSDEPLPFTIDGMVVHYDVTGK
jgi:hypothetical protein